MGCFLGMILALFLPCLSSAPLSLQTVVHGWPSFSAAAQQELFDAALIIASEGGWEQLEEQLALALEAAA